MIYFTWGTTNDKLNLNSKSDNQGFRLGKKNGILSFTFQTIRIYYYYIIYITENLPQESRWLLWIKNNTAVAGIWPMRKFLIQGIGLNQWFENPLTCS